MLLLAGFEDISIQTCVCIQAPFCMNPETSRTASTRDHPLQLGYCYRLNSENELYLS